MVPGASYEALALDGLPLPFGSLGEHLVVVGLPSGALPPGIRLRMGGALVEVTEACTVCRALAAIHPRLPKLAYGRRGFYLRVVRAGGMAIGDAVTVDSGKPRP